MLLRCGAAGVVSEAWGASVGKVGRLGAIIVVLVVAVEFCYKVAIGLEIGDRSGVAGCCC